MSYSSTARWRTKCSLLGGMVIGCAICWTGCNQVTSQALNAEGVRLFQNGNYPQAAEHFHKAIASDPRSANGYYNLASSLHKSGKLYQRETDLKQAEQLYNQCLDNDPDHAECYRGLAVLLRETGHQDASFRLLEGWAARSPRLADPRIELARLLEETSRTQEATAQLVEALSIDPNDSRALTALGRLRDRDGNMAQALANYSRSLSINRFQPEIEARVAALQAAGNAPTIISSPTETRTVRGSQSSVRY